MVALRCEMHACLSPPVDLSYLELLERSRDLGQTPVSLNYVCLHKRHSAASMQSNHPGYPWILNQ